MNVLNNAQLVLWDLDRCLLDPSSMGNRFLDPLLNTAQWEEYGLTRAEVAEGLWRWSFFDAVRNMRIPEDVANRMLVEYRKLQVPPSARTYPDVVPTLTRYDVFAPHTTHILVTKGFPRYQRSKVAMLGITQYFTSIHVVDVEDAEQSKLGVFRSLTVRHNPQSVVVIGDGADELSAANVLGFYAIQTVRPGVQKFETADAHVTSLAEIFALT